MRCAVEQHYHHSDALIERLIQDAASNKTEHQSFRRRLDELEKNGKRQNDILLTLQRQADAIEAMGEKIEELVGGMRRVAGRVEEIEKEPGRRWKSMGFEIIKYLVLAAVGAALGMMMK